MPDSALGVDATLTALGVVLAAAVWFVPVCMVMVFGALKAAGAVACAAWFAAAPTVDVAAAGWRFAFRSASSARLLTTFGLEGLAAWARASSFSAPSRSFTSMRDTA